MDGVQLSQSHSHYEENVYSLTLNPQEFLVLIGSIHQDQRTPGSNHTVVLGRLSDPSVLAGSQ